MPAVGREERRYGTDEHGWPDHGVRDQAEESGPAQCNQRKKTNESAIMRESRMGEAAQRPQEAEGRG